jgi:hypothetical protein
MATEEILGVDMHDAVMGLKRAIENGSLKINSPITIRELEKISYGADGRVDPSTVGSGVRATIRLTFQQAYQNRHRTPQPQRILKMSTAGPVMPVIRAERHSDGLVFITGQVDQWIESSLRSEGSALGIPRGVASEPAGPSRFSSGRAVLKASEHGSQFGRASEKVLPAWSMPSSIQTCHVPLAKSTLRRC